MVKRRASGSRTIAAARSIRWRSKARSRARCGWAWGRRSPRRRNITTACRFAPTCSTTACRRSSSRRPSRCTSSRRRSERSVRREGSERRLAVRLPAGAHECDRRRDRHAADRTAGVARSLLEAITARAGAPSDCARAARRACKPVGGRGLRWNASRRSRYRAAHAARGRRCCSPPTPGARLIAGGTDLIPNLRRGSARRRFWSISAASPELDEIDDRATARRSAPASRSRGSRPMQKSAPACRSLAEAAADGGRPRASHRRDARRQSLPRHPLRVLQPERVVASLQRVLPEARRRYVPRRAAGQALPRRIQRRSRAGAARARRRRRDRGAARRPPRCRSPSSTSTTAPRISARAPARSWPRFAFRRSRPRARADTARRVPAARSIFRSPASRCARDARRAHRRSCASR